MTAQLTISHPSDPTCVPVELSAQVLDVLKTQSLRDRLLKESCPKLANEAIKKLNVIRLDQEKGWEIFELAKQCQKDCGSFTKWNLMNLSEFQSMFCY